LVPAGDIRLKTGHRVENREPVRRGGFLIRRSPAGAGRLNRTSVRALRFAVSRSKSKKENALRPAILRLKKQKKEKEKMDQVKNGPSDVERRSRGRERRDDD
jgi:hypothetical protein